MTIRTPAKLRGKPNIAPLIDVVFLLLIFFLLTSAMMSTDRYQIDLPEAASGEEPLDDPIVVLINRSGRYAVNNESVPLDRLAVEIERAMGVGRPAGVTVKADSSATAADVVAAMKAIQEAGLEEFGIAADPVVRR